VAFNWLELRDEGPLFGKRLGLIGFGEIGALVAARASAFGMSVAYYQRTELSPADTRALHVTYRPVDALLAESDFVSVQVPDTPETRGLLNRDRLRLLRPTAYLINTSRGHVVDETALAELLAAGRIAGAGLDVFQDEPLPADSPLTRLPNVILTPHIGGGGPRTLRGEMDAAFARILTLWKESAS
jgi:phosphoglycerate dehydrogenase-like enzyme